MNNVTRKHPLEAQVTDYINNRLTGAALMQFEDAVADDAALADIVAFERRIKKVVGKEPQAHASKPSFATLEGKLRDETARADRRAWALPGMAAIMLALAIGIGSWDFSSDDDYRTLSDDGIAYEQATLRIIATTQWSEAEQLSFLSQYNLRIVASYPEANTIDVLPSQATQVQSVADKLARDPRVRIARVLPPSQGQ
ncbi:MAG: hypothetical protein AAF004_03630 [Pseudomonadota bacterium]